VLARVSGNIPDFRLVCQCQAEWGRGKARQCRRISRNVSSNQRDVMTTQLDVFGDWNNIFAFVELRSR
jgi:hypothetical protein